MDDTTAGVQTRCVLVLRIQRGQAAVRKRAFKQACPNELGLGPIYQYTYDDPQPGPIRLWLANLSRL